MELFLRWWVMILVVVAGAIITWIAGGFTMIYEGDPTMISFVVIGVAAFMSVRLGELSWKLCRMPKDATLHDITVFDVNKESGWLSSTMCSRVGLVGTMWGFIVALDALSGLNFDDPASLQHTIVGVTVGVKIALYTTLVGQLSNIIINVQTFNLSQGIQHRLNKYENNPE